MFSAISNLLHIPYNWATKLVYLAIINALWVAIVGPYQRTIEIWTIYMMNVSFFLLFPESAMVTIEQLIITASTFGILVWIFSDQHHGLPNSHRR